MFSGPRSLLLFLSACAAPGNTAPAPVAPRPAERGSSAGPAGAREAPVPAGRELDLAVQLDFLVSEFSVARKQISSEDGRGRRWSPRMRASWSRLVVRAQDLLDRPPGDFPRPLLLRTRVALDTDLEATVGQMGPVPPELADAYRVLVVLLDRHVRSTASPSLEERRAPFLLRWPVGQPLITSPFGPRADPIADSPGTRFHAGLDLAASTGDLVLAAAGGRVSFAGWLDGRGHTIVLRHSSAWSTVYAHLREFLVAKDGLVSAGTPIGLAGASGRATGPHLHFELRNRGEPVDPLPHLPSPGAP